MSFTPNIPTVNMSLGTSRIPIVNNFSNLYNTSAVNHYEGNTIVAPPLAPGKHKYVQMPTIPNAVVTDPPTNPANQLSLYTKSVSGRSTLYYKKDNSLDEWQLTGVDPLNASEGYTFLPGGLLIQFGSYTAPGGTTNTHTLPIAFTNLASFFGVCVSVADSTLNNVFLSAQPTAADKFQINRQLTTSTKIFYIAIGALA